MAFRYCPECDEWYETAQYTVDDSGETVCKENGHGALHGYIDQSIKTVDDYRAETSRTNIEDEINAALEQDLLTDEPRYL